MDERMVTRAIPVCAVLLVPWLATPTNAADALVIEGRKPETDTRKLATWVGRLTGQFSFTGTVERRSAAGSAMDRTDVRGISRCARIGTVAAVQCQITATSPD